MNYEPKWVQAAALELAEPLIPDPKAPELLLKSFRGIRVAFEGAFLQIDCRGTDADSEAEFAWYAIPAAAVRLLTVVQEGKGQFEMLILDEDDSD